MNRELDNILDNIPEIDVVFGLREDLEREIQNWHNTLVATEIVKARIEEVTRFQHSIAWHIVHDKPYTKNGLRIAMSTIDDRLNTIKIKEIKNETKQPNT